MNMVKNIGWRKEPARHALASKGIKTRNRLAQSQLDRIQRGGAVKGTAGRRTFYASALRGLARKYTDEEDVLAAITEDDYDKAVRPLFDSLADADELTDRGEMKAAVNTIKLAQDQFELMKEKFNVITNEDGAQFETALGRITEKTVAGSRHHIDQRGHAVAPGPPRTEGA
jgi:FtsZ-binding cell division protein ZapB